MTQGPPLVPRGTFLDTCRRIVPRGAPKEVVAQNWGEVGVNGELKNSGMSVGYCTLCSSILCPGSYQSLPPPIACSRKSSFLILAATQSCTGDSMA